MRNINALLLFCLAASVCGQAQVPTVEDVTAQVRAGRSGIPGFEAFIVESARYTKDASAFYKRDLSDWDYEESYRWAFADGRIARDGSINTKDPHSNGRPVKTREVYDGKTTKFLGTPSQMDIGRVGQGAFMSRGGLDNRIDLLHFGYKVEAKWLDETIVDGGFTIIPSTHRFSDELTLCLRGKNSDGRDTTIWLSPSHGMLATRSLTHQSDGTSVYYELKKVDRLGNSWVPSEGEWGVVGEDSGKALSLKKGFIRAEKISSISADSELLKEVKFPNGSMVTDTDANKHFRMVDGKLVPYDPFAKRTLRNMTPGWLFLVGGLIFLGVVTRILATLRSRGRRARAS